MTGPPRPAPADELLSQLVEERLKRLSSKFGNDALAWLALAPTWTEPAASAASFPSRHTPLPQFLDDASEHGLVDREPPLRADPDLGRSFWISDNDREAVLDFLRRTEAFGMERLTSTTVQIAQRLQQAQASTPMPEELRHWSDLARNAGSLTEAARQLGDDVLALTREKKTGEAIARVDAGKALAQTLGTTQLDAAIGVGSRRIGLAYRQAADARHLKRYFHRHEQEAAFNALLDPMSPAWALHYLGVGGAGKTMLMRWITTPQNGETQTRRERVVSRIDFDELKPEYPVRKPGQLLLDLAVELRRFGQSTHEETLFKVVSDNAHDLHAILGAAPPPSNPLFNVERPEFDRILRPFCDLVGLLPPPVVLILDTCEELARVPVVKGILPSIEATFRILERVHLAVPSVRVVFAGRRPIASSGHGWTLREAGSDDASQRGFRQFLKERTYLALHEVRGVTRDEAREFLFARAGRPLAPDLEEAVRARSLEPGRAADVVPMLGPATLAVADDPGGPRYSLFDLALYGDWLREDPTLDAKRIASGSSDPYVDLRIVQRVRQPAIQAALPAVAALGRFDAPMLRGAFPATLSGEAYEDLYRQLGDYEWLELQRESGSDTLFLEVDRNLLPRMRAYFDDASRRSDAAQVIARLVPGLSAFLRRTRLGDLSASHLAAALAILPPAEAARLWVEVLLRVRSQADVTWLRTTTERLIGVEFEAARRGRLERGFDLAANAVAMLAGSPRSPSLEAMKQREWPDDVTAPWIDRLGSVASRPLDWLEHSLKTFRFQPERPEPALGPTRLPDDVLARRMSEEEAGAIVGALEHRAGILPPASAFQPRFKDVEPLAMVVADWTRQLQAHHYPAPLVGMAQMLTAKLWAVAWNRPEANAWSRQALETADAIEHQPSGLWLFWTSPEAACDRIRHELLLVHEDVSLASFPDPVSWLPGALSRNASIDGERLASAIERHLLDRELPEPTELGISEVADTYVRERTPVTAAHRRTPELFVTLAMKHAALGAFTDADSALQGRALTAEKDGAVETVRNATMARVEVACLSRHVPRELPSVVGHMTRDIKRSTSARHIAATKALLGVDMTDGFDASPHDIWRSTVFATERQRAQGIADFLTQRETRPVHSLESLSLCDALDVVEALRLGSRDDRLRSLGLPRAEVYVENAADLLPGMLRLYALDPGRRDAFPESIHISASLSALLFPDGDVAGSRVDTSHVVRMVREIALAIEDGAFKIARENRTNAGQGSRTNAVRLVDHFGIRRWTAVAQEEGELLALRLPQEASLLLHIAEMLAVASGDPQARLAAVTIGSLAALRPGVDEIAESAHQRLEPAWTQAAGAEAWQAIEATARELQDPVRGAREFPPAAALPLRGGWVARAVLSVMARTFDPQQHDLVRASQRFVRHFPDAAAAPEITAVRGDGVTTGDAPAARPSPAPAPPESPQWLMKTVTIGLSISLVALWIYAVRINAFGPTGTPTPTSTPLLFPLLGIAGAFLAAGLVFGRTVLRFIVGAIGLVFVAICFSYWFVGSVVDLLIPESLVAGRLSQSWRVAAMFAAIFGLSALEPALRRLRARVARRSEAFVSAHSSSSRSDLRSEIAATTAVDLRIECTSLALGVGFVPSRTERHDDRTITISALQPYAESAGAVDPDDDVAAIKSLIDVRSRLGQLVWPIPVETGAASYLPWEGVLGLAVAPTPSETPAVKPAGEPVFFYRWGPPRSGASPPDAWSIGAVQVLGTASDVWRNRIIPRQPANWLGIGPPVRAPQYTIVHAVGTPVLTSYGPRLQLADQSGFLDAQMLPERLPLLILQQQPADSQARVTSDREQAALLRAVAADLFESTCDAVVVIPSLPPELAERVVKRIAKDVSAGRFGFDLLARALGSSESRRGELAVRRLATVVRSARDLVFSSDDFERPAARLADVNPRLSGDRWAGREVAWDFCLFARPRDAGGAIHIGRSPA